MIRLSRNITDAPLQHVTMPPTELYALPERILQFGTGVLLRGLCDFIIDEANRKGLFNGRVVVVKSTDAGDTKAFDEQDNLYTVCIRGVDHGSIVEKNIICASISRVLSAKQKWTEILQTVHDPQMQVIVSNTTEVGLQLVNEKINANVPTSFPGKLLAVLHSRFTHLRNTEESRIIVIPTELLSDNGKILRSIVKQLSAYNDLGDEFNSWLDEKVTFCNSLVDRIVTKDPGQEMLAQIEQQLGYRDELLTMCEDYALWAIEGSPAVADVLTFASGTETAFVVPDISIFKFLKLHLLNGTHTLSASLACLAGYETVREGMADPVFASYVKHLQKDIARAIPYDIPESEIQAFSAKVLDRFRNPYLQHKWINITLQNTLKMRNRNVPVLSRYFQLYGTAPQYMAAGFAAFLLFMKPVKNVGGLYYGTADGHDYIINDEHAKYFYDVWQGVSSAQEVAEEVLSNENLWRTNLAANAAFAEAVKEKLSSMMTRGVRETINNI